MMLGITDGDSLFVVFVGAGGSAMPPSALPTLNGFNSLLLQTLLEILSDRSSHRQPTEQILEGCRTRHRRSQKIPEAPAE
jgi:hypothetical protein